ncbi:MAG TPA: DNA polymerase III subunit alpha [Cyclobacteriaceae bacterium]|nr:DNA polymerase III subunit alpha [Cyclobacteriaceae bacterium]
MYLNIHSWYSFKFGTLSPERIFELCKVNGVRKIVLTDINNSAAYVEMLRIASENRADYDLEIVLGMEFRHEHQLRFVALAKNNEGFTEINRYRSYLNNESLPVPVRAPGFKDVFVVYPYTPDTDLGLLRENEFLGVRSSQLTKLRLSPSPSVEKMVVFHPVTFCDKRTHNIHRLLRAIDHNTLLSKLAPHQQAHDDEAMIPEAELEKRFSGFPDIIANTKRIMKECSFRPSFGSDKNKKSIFGSEDDDWELLKVKAEEGFATRYDMHDPVARERLQRELGVIKIKNFCPYYLIAYDLVKFADSRGFDHVGRGSGANSMVAYCLGITDVDPLELDLYFERFLNTERTSPPDFDLDFSWKDRDAIYEYIFQKYTTAHACLLGTHVTMQKRSVLRELGKVFGLPKEEIDNIVEFPEEHHKRDEITELVFRYAEYMHGMPSNLSIHAGGVLISEKPVYTYTCTGMPQKGYPVAHLDMHQAEDIGLHKLDVLSQRGLGHIKETVRLVKLNQNKDVDVYRFRDFKKDEKVRKLLRSSRAMGCFYVESPAMRMLLGKLQCDDYLTLVAASSIIRPGVAMSGMMRAYIERFHSVRNGKEYESIHPMMDELMRETYGVMVYQEDVIKVAHHFAGLTLTEADVLRRGMSGKYRSRKEFEKVKETFFANCKAKGYAQTVTDRVWYEIESFAGYSFAKGHSASYAVESYQSLFLKAYYPLEFMVGVINNFGGFYQTEFYFHEARMSGATIEPPCVNNSEYHTTISGTLVYMGFIHLKSLETKVAQEIALERERHGPFITLNNFLRRVELGLEQIRILIRVGAFRFTGKNKQKLLWEAMLYYSEAKVRKPSTADLFDTEPKEYPLPAFEIDPIEDAFDQMELIGYPLGNPFRLLPDDNYGNTTARELQGKLNKNVSIMGYVITTKDTRTRNGQLMHFGTFYDKNGEVFDTVHYPNLVKKYPFRGRGFYMIKGKVTEDFGVYMIEVSEMEKMPMMNKRDLPEDTIRQGLGSPSTRANYNKV